MFDGKILKPITRAIYISSSIGPIDNEDALTLGRDLINLLFSQRCLQTFFIFLSRAVASLADVFEKNEKKNKTILPCHLRIVKLDLLDRVCTG